MSHQGSKWSREITQPKKGTKSVLNGLGGRLDQRINRGRADIGLLAQDVGLSLRQVKRELKKLEKRDFWDGYPLGIVKREGGGKGAGDVYRYSFVGFEVEKGDIRCSRVTFATGKSDVEDPSGVTFATGKDDIRDMRINRVRAQEELQKKKPQGREEEKKPSLSVDREGGPESDLEWAKRFTRR
jgi:DNA-binding Lrp family transcriptional regulator